MSTWMFKARLTAFIPANSTAVSVLEKHRIQQPLPAEDFRWEARLGGTVAVDIYWKASACSGKGL